MGRGGQWEVHAKELSYFSRLADSATFTRAATVELQRRGDLSGGDGGGAYGRSGVAAEVPGLPPAGCGTHPGLSSWGGASEPGSSGRVGAGYGGEHSLAGEAGPHPQAWRSGPSAGGTAGLARGGCQRPGRVRDETLRYLEKRREQISYAQFLAMGYPIGSGSVESANKLVVENRLKGSGMHWARANVNPMVALRGMSCSDRWGEGWPAL